MKRILILSILMSLLMMVPTISNAIEMPDISIDGYMLYNMNSNQTTLAPGISANIFTAFNGIVEGNVGVAFPAQNTDSSRDYVAGPIMDINMVNVLKNIKGIEITAKELQWSAGIGIMVDIFHFNGNDLKQTIYPAAHLRFTF